MEAGVKECVPTTHFIGIYKATREVFLRVEATEAIKLYQNSSHYTHVIQGCFGSFLCFLSVLRVMEIVVQKA